MEFLHTANARYVWLIAASLIAGVMNAMAGGGSFLSFPAMLGVGVPPVQANATNTVALWPGQVTSLVTLWKDVRRDLLVPVGIACVTGGVAGAETLLHTSQTVFLRLIPWLILVGTATFAASGPVSRWVRERAGRSDDEHPIAAMPLILALLPICFYIGYFGAGGGFLVMTVLGMMGMSSMHRLNALKVFAALGSNFVAIVTFVIKGAVMWHYCLISMVFAGLGGWLGARMTQRVSGEFLRWFVIATGCVIAAYFFIQQARGA